jgi:hypothetical protein
MLIVMVLAFGAPQDMPTPSPPPQQQADGTQRWSILADPCAAANGGPNEIVVCGQGAAASPRLPLPGERGPPDRPSPSNPDRSGIGALNVASAPCATRSEGCTTGIDLFGGTTFLVRTAGKLINPDSCCEEPGEATNPVGLVNDVGSVLKRTFGKKPKVDKSKRVPIPLDDSPLPLPPPDPAAPAR